MFYDDNLTTSECILEKVRLCVNCDFTKCMHHNINPLCIQESLTHNKNLR